MRRSLAAACALAATWAVPALCAPAAASAPPAPHLVTADGIHIVSEQAVDPRLITVKVTTNAIPAVLNIYVLLPSGYASHPHKRYPVFYLLHGTSGTASDWTKMGDAEQITAPYQMIVVMPDIAINDGGGGWCSDWPNGAQKWETFHIDQLLPWVQSNFRTLNSRGERAIAGLSQGGFCSMSYAAQFPNLFGAALAYSGAPDIAWDPEAHAGALAVINATEVALDHVPPDTFFGNPATDFINWAAHDPATLAPNLRWTKMYLYFGNGMAGPYDTNPPNPAAASIEALIYQDNLYFHNRLDSLGIKPAVYDDYGNGTHSWPYWTRDLRWSIGPLMADFEHPAPAPKTFSYESASPSYSLYGWTVTMHRQVREFSTLSQRGKFAFTLAGSGSATVVTPARYARSSDYLVRIRTASGSSTRRVRSSPRGTLTLTVPLGRSDTVQEYSAGGPPTPSPGTTVYTTDVTFKRVGR